MIKKVINWIEENCPKKTVRLEGQDYLKRYTLVRTPFFKIYLHHILRSDTDRNLHDHPWNFVTLILSGGYVEEFKRDKNSKQKTLYHGPWSLLFRPAKVLHRLEMKEPTYSLFLCGRKFKDWGFLVNDKIVSHKEYDDLGEHILDE